MKVKTVLPLAFGALFLALPALAAPPEDTRPKIGSYLNKPILMEDSFAGQSITLVKENERYYVVRRIFGSGVPMIRCMKYETTLKSDYRIDFSGTTSQANEKFVLMVEDQEVALYLNGLKVVIVQPGSASAPELTNIMEGCPERANHRLR